MGNTNKVRKSVQHGAKQCLQCGGDNHCKVNCRARPQKSIAMQPAQCDQRRIHSVRECNPSDSDEERYIFSVETVNGVQEYPSQLFAEMMLSGYRVDFQMDSGSTVNIISEDDYKLYMEIKP